MKNTYLCFCNYFLNSECELIFLGKEFEYKSKGKQKTENVNEKLVYLKQQAILM